MNKAAKRQPGGSGRLHRTITGEWVWSSEEEDNGGDSDESENEANLPMNRIMKADSSDSENDDQSELTMMANAMHLKGSSEMPPINLVLRMRNQKGELHDIRFEFAVGKDTAEGIAAELVEAGLVDSRDTASMSSNLKKLIDNRNQSKSITFLLVSTYVPGEPADEKALICYAQISITD